MRILSREEIQDLISTSEAVAAVDAAFRSLARGKVRLPDPINLELPEAAGEVHVKGAYIDGAPFFVFKVATGFYRNPERGLPSGSGMMMVFDATTGEPAALLLDGGWLTDLRTGAAGALATRHLAREQLALVVVVGAGAQARHQLRCLAAVRSLARVLIWNRNPGRAATCAQEVGVELGLDVASTTDLATAVGDADLVFTVTPSREPLIEGSWLSAGVHVNAIGSDAPDKQELHPDVLRRADLLVADNLEQCRKLGEIHHALASGAISLQDVDAELGEIVAGQREGRTAPDQITVCDLTGVGVQDAAIAARVLAAALR